MPNGFLEPEDIKLHCKDHSGNMSCLLNLKKDVEELMMETKKKVNWTVFTWIIGGICSIGVFVVSIQMNLATGTKDNLAELKTTLIEGTTELKSELRHQRENMDCVRQRLDLLERNK